MLRWQGDELQVFPDTLQEDSGRGYVPGQMYQALFADKPGGTSLALSQASSLWILLIHTWHYYISALYNMQTSFLKTEFTRFISGANPVVIDPVVTLSVLRVKCSLPFAFPCQGRPTQKIPSNWVTGELQKRQAQGRALPGIIHTRSFPFHRVFWYTQRIVKERRNQPLTSYEETKHISRWGSYCAINLLVSISSSIIFLTKEFF